MAQTRTIAEAVEPLAPKLQVAEAEGQEGTTKPRAWAPGICLLSRDAQQRELGVTVRGLC